MPTDTRRISGPDSTVPYHLYIKSKEKSFGNKITESCGKNGSRFDGRKNNEHRKIFMKTGIVSQAKGSAYIELNKTKVIVSVYDPREIPKKNDYSVTGQLYCDFKFAPFSCTKRRQYQQDAEEKQFSVVLRRALESAVCLHEFPNFQVDIYALVLENDGGVLSAAVTAAGLALAHAGIPMYDTVISVTLGLQGNIMLVDPTLEEEILCNTTVYKHNDEEYNNHGIITISMLSTHQQISEFYQTGNLNFNDISEAINLLVHVAKCIVPLIEKCLVKHVIKEEQKISSGE